jgi:tRNA uridine 5-carboxymethylaminomethyl modification enzyme
MFTSAAEHRLLLRADNADERLAEIGHELGLLGREQVERVRAKVAAIAAESRRLERVMVSVPNRLASAPGEGGAGGIDGEERSVRALELLSRPDVTYAALARHGVETHLPPAWGECLDVRVRYRGYIAKQERTAVRSAGLERHNLPAALWDEELNGVSREATEKLVRWRPANLAQAGRIAGVSPADLAVLMVLARRASRT